MNIETIATSKVQSLISKTDQLCGYINNGVIGQAKYTVFRHKVHTFIILGRIALSNDGGGEK